MDRMRVGVMTAPGHVEMREVFTPQPRWGELLVKIEACGICTTEQRIYSGAQSWERFPYVGGHEAVGIVEAVGPDTMTDLKIGDHVAIFSATCGYCFNCRRGRTSKCLHRDAFWEHGGLWGTWGFADYRLVKPRGLQFIHSDVPFEQAALAEPLSCAVHAARKARVELGDEVVIIGAGAMGLLNALVFRAMGATVTVLDLQDARCQRALDAGVARVFVPDNSLVERLMAMTGESGPDLIVVASSSPQAYELGRSLLGPMGRLLAFAAVYPHAETGVDMTQVHRNEMSLFGAVSSDLQDILIVGRLLSNRLLDVSKAIECVMPFERFAEAMELALRPDTYRVVLRM